jgi:hypothetical protein
MDEIESAASGGPVDGVERDAQGEGAGSGEPQSQPRHQPTPDSPGHLITRRRVLLGTAGIVVAGGVGVAVAAARPAPEPARPPQPPSYLVDALAAERRLVAGLTASAAAAEAGSYRSLLTQLAADHRAHADAVAALLADYPGAATGIPSPTSIPLTTARLRSAERRASAAAARRAAAHTGTTATLFASIAACEASHASLLGTS